MILALALALALMGCGPADPGPEASAGRPEDTAPEVDRSHLDIDGDGYIGAEDCDDLHAGVPGPAPWYVDGDGDGFGDPGDAVASCEPVASRVEAGGDCDDADPDVHPDAWDSCLDDLDADCDGEPRPSCRVAGRVELDRAPGRLLGGSDGGRAGMSVAGVGDVDLDGFDDLLVGAPNEDGSLGEGAAYLVHGPVLGTSLLPDAASAIFEGGGAAVAGAGDLDGNGTPDLLVSGHLAVHVLYTPLSGRFALASDHRVELLTSGTFTGAGDLDQDGYAEILVSDPFASGGAVYLYEGPIEGQLGPEAAVTTWRGDETWGMGLAPATPGDLDGDGRPDVVLRVGTWTPEGTSRGVKVYTDVSGGVLGPHDAQATLLGTPGQEEAGAWLSGAGDVDADGYGDLLVGTANRRAEGYWEEQRMAAYLVLGPVSGESSLADAHTRFECVEPGEGYGGSVGGPGDLDGDGFDDVLIGQGIAFDQLGAEGAIYLFYGTPPSGVVGLAAADARFVGDVWSFAGRNIAAVGDVNGDGLADFMAGSPDYDDWYDLDPSPTSGIAWVWYGGGW